MKDDGAGRKLTDAEKEQERYFRRELARLQVTFLELQREYFSQANQGGIVLTTANFVKRQARLEKRRQKIEGKRQLVAQTQWSLRSMQGSCVINSNVVIGKW